MTRKRLFFLICAAGIALALLLAGITLYLFIRSGRPPFAGRGGEAGSGDSFYQKLKDYDDFAASRIKPAAVDLGRRLDALEKEALGSVSHLSLLKRRRALARAGSSGANDGGRGAYFAAVERAMAKFPREEAILAVAAEAAVRAGAPEKAAEYAAGITGKSLLPLAFGAAAIEGLLETPEKAAALEGADGLFLAAGTVSGEPARTGFIVNAAIIRVLRGDIRGAGALMPELSAGENGAGDPAGKAPRFAGEYYYDFGEPRRAADIFMRLDDEAALGRAADTLALAGEQEQAKSLWRILSAPDENGSINTPPETLVRCLYNLAAVAETPEEELALVRQALSVDPGHLYSLIRYSRHLSVEQAEAVLGGDLVRDEPLAGLELLKRRRETQPVERIIPETWLLLNRHSARAGAAPGGEEGIAVLYRWGCYYFDFQKQYGETVRLIRSAERNGAGGPWLDFHRALALIRGNDFAGGEALLLAIEEERGLSGGRADPARPDDGAFWVIPANLGRVREAARSYTAALDYYEAAAAQLSGKSGDSVNAARIYYRIARCLRSLSRDREARDAVERGLSLDSGNPLLILELTRLNEAGG